jgi:hypothetical protein
VGAGFGGIVPSLSLANPLPHTLVGNPKMEKTENLSLSQIHELLDYSFEHTAKTICTGFTSTGRRRIS